MIVCWSQYEGSQQKFRLAKHYNVVMITHSFKEVRTAVSYRGYSEVERPQPGGAGCGRCFS
jgi:hypothetical protein